MTEQPAILDYSFNHPHLDQLPASIVGVCRYLRGTGAKPLSATEAAQIHASGRWIAINDEMDQGAALGGASRGTQDGRAAGAAARALGIPTTTVIHPSVDQDTNSSQWPTIVAYLRAFGAASGYPVGGYLEADLLDYCHNAGVLATGYAWQPRAWSNGRVSQWAAAYQYLNGQQMAGGTVDFNRLINLSGLGVWFPNGHTPEGGGTVIAPPTPATPSTPTDEDDMTQSFLVPGKKADGTPSDRWWNVAIDYTSRVQVLDIDNAKKLAGDTAAARLPFINASMTYGQLCQVPDLTNHGTAQYT